MANHDCSVCVGSESIQPAHRRSWSRRIPWCWIDNESTRVECCCRVVLSFAPDPSPRRHRGHYPARTCTYHIQTRLLQLVASWRATVHPRCFAASPECRISADSRTRAARPRNWQPDSTSLAADPLASRPYNINWSYVDARNCHRNVSRVPANYSQTSYAAYAITSRASFGSVLRAKVRRTASTHQVQWTCLQLLRPSCMELTACRHPVHDEQTNSQNITEISFLPSSFWYCVVTANCLLLGARSCPYSNERPINLHWWWWWWWWYSRSAFPTIISSRAVWASRHHRQARPRTATGRCATLMLQRSAVIFSLRDCMTPRSQTLTTIRRTVRRGSPSRSRHPCTTARRSSSLWTAWNLPVVRWSTPSQANVGFVKNCKPGKSTPSRYKTQLWPFDGFGY